MQRSADRSWIVAAAYVAAMLLYVYGVANRSATYGSDVAVVAVLAGLALLHLATGWFANGWWAVLLPIAAVILSIPAGYPKDGYEPLPIWFGLAVFGAPIGMALIAGALLARRLLKIETPGSGPGGPDPHNL